MDEWQLQAGVEWRANIGNGILGCKVVVFLATDNSVQSEWCLKELFMAKNFSKFILPVWYKTDLKLDFGLNSVIYSQTKFDITSQLDLDNPIPSTFGGDSYLFIETLRKLLRGGSIKTEISSKRRLSIEKKYLNTVISDKPIIFIACEDGDLQLARYINLELQQNGFNSTLYNKEKSELFTNQLIENCYAFIPLITFKMGENKLTDHMTHLISVARTNQKTILAILTQKSIIVPQPVDYMLGFPPYYDFSDDYTGFNNIHSLNQILVMLRMLETTHELQKNKQESHQKLDQLNTIIKEKDSTINRISNI